MKTDSSPASAKSVMVVKKVPEAMRLSFFAAMASVVASRVPPRQ